jgi:titin
MLEILEGRQLLATVYTPVYVTNTSDHDDGSLRWAINKVNSPGSPYNAIDFKIADDGLQTIVLDSPLPNITRMGGVLIDGYTEPGASPNGRAFGDNAVLNVAIDGRRLHDGASGLVLVGGSIQVRGLIIDNFDTSTGAGIRIRSDQNQVQGNFIGTDSTGSSTGMGLGNWNGVVVERGVGYQIGGPAVGDRNVISANIANGIELDGPSARTEVLNNYVGTDKDGRLTLGNGVRLAGVPDAPGCGILVLNSPGNFIGGTALGARNVCSGNQIHGVQLDGPGATGNVVQGNYIGTNAAGNGAVPNVVDGVGLNSAPGNTIGGTAVEDRNVISGNSQQGIYLLRCNGTVVQGNYIGVDVNGMAALPNLGNGLHLELSPFNTIGGLIGAAGNVIAGNGQWGVALGRSSSGNVVQGNYIGTDKIGIHPLGNSSGGVTIEYSSADNLIGGTTDTARNIISGNHGSGVQLTGVGTSGNLVQGNYIGTDKTGEVRLGNEGDGVYLETGATGNLIGGAVAGARNVIAANGRLTGQSGIELTRAAGNLVEGNFIGTNKRGTTALGNGTGVSVFDAAGNVIGGASLLLGRNVISGNLHDGVLISGTGAMATVVEGNFIGTTVNGTGSLPNGGDGVQIRWGAHDNVIGLPCLGNTIAFNGQNGVEVLDPVVPDSRTINNGIRGNSIHDNARLGIDLNGDGPTPNDMGDPDEGPNHLQNVPVLTEVIPGAPTKVSLKLNSLPGHVFMVDFYVLGTGNYLGTAFVVTNGAGDGVLTRIALPGHTFSGVFVTCTATDLAWNTSEFSSPFRAFPAATTRVSSGSGPATLPNGVSSPVPGQSSSDGVIATPCAGPSSSDGIIATPSGSLSGQPGHSSHRPGRQGVLRLASAHPYDNRHPSHLGRQPGRHLREGSSRVHAPIAAFHRTHRTRLAVAHGNSPLSDWRRGGPPPAEVAAERVNGLWSTRSTLGIPRPSHAKASVVERESGSST